MTQRDTGRLADRLTAARRRSFVGRTMELAAFRELLAPDAAEVVLFVHGPGGTGKSTLLRQFGWLAEDAGRTVLWLDGRDIAAGPPAALAVLGLAGEPLSELPRVVLMIDNAELIGAMDAWLREDLLPSLAGDAVIVLAGREPPSVIFRADPGWRSVLRAIRLTNLDASGATELLTARGVPRSVHREALAFTHGHPLALALFADVCEQSGGTPAGGASPEVLGVLLHSLIGSVPTPGHRAALEAGSQVRTITEPLLAAMLAVPDARELFDWLRDLSIIDYAPRGLFPHEFVRETLASELRWRHPDAYAAMRARARAYYHQRFTDSDAAAQREVLFDFAFLYRDNPVLGPFLRHVNAGAAESGGLTVGRARAAEWPALLEMITRHEGAESAAHARAWHDTQPACVSAVRDSADQPVGVIVAPMLDAATPAERAEDPVAAAAWRAAGERDGAVLLVRHWLDSEQHQAVTPVSTVITVSLVRQYLATPRLVSSFVTFADPDFWAGAMKFTDFHRVPGTGLFSHDWQAVPPLAWMVWMAERSTGEPPATETVAVLDEAAFAAAVRAALRDLARVDRLGSAALGDSRIVAARLNGGADRGRTVRDVVLEAATALENSPRDRRAYRAVHHTFLQPAPTQAAAAELLDLPMSTYRRHLAAGVARLVEILWQWELAVAG